jgi:two-component system, sensor histidine kinase and response regulator
MKEPQPKLLIIDDEANIVMGLQAVLRREGYVVMTAGRGSEGLQLARDHCPDLILSDVMMPPPNGFELKKILSQDPQTADIPFIFLTARTAGGDKINGLKMGADDYITKPFQVEELLVRLEAVLRRDQKGSRKGYQKGYQEGYQEMSASLELLRTSIATNLGHELRTPLTVIMAALELALREKYVGAEEQMDWYLNTAKNSASRLNALVSDLIMLYDIDQDAVSRFRQLFDLKFDFAIPAKKVLDHWHDKQIVVETKIDPALFLYVASPDFTQAVCHLIDNACKFSPPGGKVTITLKENGNGGGSLIVQDEGPGIPVHLREKVFERYFQISQGDTREHGGLGIGLFVARAVAQAIGGDVMIMDSKRGCKVRMIIPPYVREGSHAEN